MLCSRLWQHRRHLWLVTDGPLPLRSLATMNAEGDGSRRSSRSIFSDDTAANAAPTEAPAMANHVTGRNTSQSDLRGLMFWDARCRAREITRSSAGNSSAGGCNTLPSHRARAASSAGNLIGGCCGFFMPAPPGLHRPPIPRAARRALPAAVSAAQAPGAGGSRAVSRGTPRVAATSGRVNSPTTCISRTSACKAGSFETSSCTFSRRRFWASASAGVEAPPPSLRLKAPMRAPTRTTDAGVCDGKDTSIRPPGTRSVWSTPRAENAAKLAEDQPSPLATDPPPHSGLVPSSE
jgi:hypothetical protein